jgi:hypothetical protein
VNPSKSKAKSRTRHRDWRPSVCVRKRRYSVTVRPQLLAGGRVERASLSAAAPAKGRKFLFAQSFNMTDQTNRTLAASRNQFSVGEVVVELTGDCNSDVALATPLLLFQSDTGDPDIRIRVEWTKSLRTKSRQRLFDSGAVWQMYDTEEGFVFDFNALTLGSAPYKTLFVDKYFRKAELQMNETCFVDRVACPLEYPLDELLIMHRLTQENAIELHGCGIVRASDEGNLFVGHSGAGKSTTTRLWTAREDVEVLSDDRIIVRRDESGIETPHEAASEFGKHEVLRLRDCSASRTNRFAQDDKTRRMRMYGTPWHGEAMYASPASALLKRIFVLEHGTGNRLISLSPSQAVAELFARSFVPFHRHEYVDSALTFLQEVADTVPVYRYAFEPDQRAVDTILNLRD